MATMIRSSAHHAKSVELFKTRLRAGQAVDAMDDAGRWVRARIVQMDESWAKCNVKWEEGGQEEWIALQGDRVRPPGEMTHGAAGLHYAPPVSAAHAAHAAASRQLRKEALVLWLFAAMLLAGAALWSEGLTSWALLAAAAWTAWFGALPRTLRSVGETWKATLSETAVANHSTEGMQGVQSQWQFWKWLRPGCKVDFCNRSGQWMRGQVLLFPFPWRTARVEFVGASGRDATEWVGISEQRMLYPGQLTNAQDTQHRNATPQGDLSGTISSQLLERSTRSANADPHGHTPTSARLDGLRDGGGYAASPGFAGGSMSGTFSPGFTGGTPFSPFAGSAGAASPAMGAGFGGTPSGAAIRSPGPSVNGSFSAMQSPMRGGFASPMNATMSPASALGASLNTSAGFGARIFDDITNEAELQQYEETHPLESSRRRASLATSPGRGADGAPWGRSPSPVRGGAMQRSSMGGIDGYANAGDAIQEYHAGEVRTSGQQATGGGTGSVGGGTRQTVEAPDALLPRLARECTQNPSPWSHSPNEDILRWSWQVQGWLEQNLIQFVGRTLFETDFLTLARGPHHPKGKALFCEDVRNSADTDMMGRQVPSEFNTLWNSDQALHQIKGIGELSIHELMRQQAPASAQGMGMGGMGGIGGMMTGTMGGGGGRKSSAGSGGDTSLLDYICMRLPKQGRRLRELQRQQKFLDAHGLADSKNARSVFIVQRLKTLSHCANLWDTRHAPSSYTWNGGFHDNHKWILPHRPGPNFPTDAEILFELFLSKDSVTPLDAEHATIGRHVITMQEGSRAPEEHLRRRGNLVGGGAFLASHSEQGLQLSVIAPKGSPNAHLPVWQVPPGQGNLPAAIALFVYYMTCVDDELGERGMWLPHPEQQITNGSGSGGGSAASATAADGDHGMCHLLGVECAGGSTWGQLRRAIFYGLSVNAGPRDPRVDGMGAALSDAELQQRLGAREAARHAGDFEQSTRLLDELRVRGVWLDNATGRWSASDGRAGLYPAAITGGHVGSTFAGPTAAPASGAARGGYASIPLASPKRTASSNIGGMDDSQGAPPFGSIHGVSPNAFSHLVQKRHKCVENGSFRSILGLFSVKTTSLSGHHSRFGTFPPLEAIAHPAVLSSCFVSMFVLYA